jgi:hypothetical protein
MISETLSISLETVRTHMSRIDHTLKIFRWIHHALTCELKHIHVTMSLQSLPKLCAHTIIDVLSSRGTKASFTTSMFEIEYGQQGMKTRLKSNTGPLRTESVF